MSKFLNEPLSKLLTFTSYFPDETQSLIGFEFELEGRGLENVDGGRFWQNITDGSLRNGGREFVNTVPRGRTTHKQSLAYLSKKLKETGVEIILSDRCSTHVHLNFQNKTLLEVAKFMTLWYLLERFFCEYSGQYRNGNLFCLRLRDATNTLEPFFYFCRRGHWRRGHKYMALNWNSLGTKGSIEIRTFRGVTDPQEASVWADLLLELYDLASSKSFGSPAEILEQISQTSPHEFVTTYLPRINREVLQSYPIEEVEAEVFESIRDCQDLAYCRVWSEEKRVKMKYSAKEGERTFSVREDERTFPVQAGVRAFRASLEGR